MSIKFLSQKIGGLPVRGLTQGAGLCAAWFKNGALVGKYYIEKL